jgi:indolepyruvate ferredoxin oxidoreductase, beta subunit
LINDYRIAPVSVSSGNEVYPSEADEEHAYATVTSDCFYVPAMELAQKLGQVRTNNVVMLGALAALLPVSADVWLRVVAERVPERFRELNQRAFESGRAYLAARLQRT